MENQLNALREILKKEIAWYTSRPEKPCIYAYYADHTSGYAIDGEHWVLWIHANEDVAKEIIISEFQSVFTLKEFDVSIGRTAIGTRYLEIIGRDITLKDILDLPKILDGEKIFLEYKKRFYADYF